MNSVILATIIIGIMVLCIAKYEAVKLDKESEDRSKRNQEDFEDYCKVCALIEKGYSDNEIYAKLDYKMLSFSIEDVRKTMVK